MIRSPGRGWRGRGAALVACWLAGAGAARAQTDEIQVYTGEINAPGQSSLTLHTNYTIAGPRRPAFPGAVVADHSLNGVPEYALGLAPWLELGAYLPLYSLTRDGRFLVNGWKLRALAAAPSAAQRGFFYGLNFELSYNARHWSQARWIAEFRPIFGWRFGPVDLILNPIVDLPFHGGPAALTFAPAERAAYNLSERWALAVEHYADFGRFADFAPVDRQYQTVFGVVDFTYEALSVEFGVGHGFTGVSEPLILKLLVTRSF